ncbi:MAG: hypothetical protein JWM16_3400 [Verrucomicrobiales bacterium]|nr:hypothetical protein [Verrucomicrobiales bacterium]
MEKCRYILGSELPPEADENQINHVRTACEMDRVHLRQLARSYTARCWHVQEAQLRKAIVLHIDEGNRLFKKYGTNGRLLPNHIQANVTLMEDLDIYVEAVLMDKKMIILNAHDHPPGVRRLPQ